MKGLAKKYSQPGKGRRQCHEAHGTKTRRRHRWPARQPEVVFGRVGGDGRRRQVCRQRHGAHVGLLLEGAGGAARNLLALL